MGSIIQEKEKRYGKETVKKEAEREGRINGRQYPLYKETTETEGLASKAAEAGMCEAGYLRLLITQKPYDYPETRSLLKTLINEVNAVGNNINQITRANNSYFYSREDKELLAAYMKKIQQVVQEVAEKVGSQ